eukprot:4991811-Amphidinium_carterae.1
MWSNAKKTYIKKKEFEDKQELLKDGVYVNKWQLLDKLKNKKNAKEHMRQCMKRGDMWVTRNEMTQER